MRDFAVVIPSEPAVRLLKDGRDVQLVGDLHFIDRFGKAWFVPAGYISNGASIPKALWSVLGSPWTGKHRVPAILHDYYCDMKTEPYRRVHRMFFDACVACGETKEDAAMLYAGVLIGGPHW